LPLKLALQVRLKLVKNGMAVRSGCGHLTIGNNVRIQAQSGVGRNVKDEEVLQEVQHLDIMIIVSLTFFYFKEHRCN
jgi:hypothetical protein